MRNESRENILTDGLLAGCFAGVITGLAEFAFHVLRHAPTLLPSLLPPMLALYIFYWGIVGLFVAIVWRAVRSTGIG
ncbi:MAG: hypothetical protein HKN20_17530, partial [Gemmatimonadetes bacterium]|nr:hypothetical protein [Gemmatimonadota bacterium]